MASSERDVTPMLSSTDFHNDEHYDSQHSNFTSRRSASISIPMTSTENYHSESILERHTGPLRNDRLTSVVQMSGPLFRSHWNGGTIWQAEGAVGQKTSEPITERNHSFNGRDRTVWSADGYSDKNDNLLKSGPLGMCNDPYCTTCPSYYHLKGNHKSKSSDLLDNKFHYMLYGDAKGWVKKIACSLQRYIPPVMNPHTKFVQQWNQFFAICCLLAVFLDPLFFFLLNVQEDKKCIVISWPMTTTLVVLRSLTDLVYLTHILIQFRLAYVAPESRVVGAGDLEDDPKRIALHYLTGYFFIDLFVVLPLPQIIILLVVPDSLGTTGANYAKNLLRTAILVQYIPRLCRFLPLLAGQSQIGLVFESAWANFIINVLVFLLSSHVVGSCWYLFGLQRVNQCLRNACRSSELQHQSCMEFIDCGHGTDFSKFASDPTWELWQKNDNATACFGGGDFDYGIYIHAVNLTAQGSITKRYIYSLFWGFQQISTLAGNQVPSYFVWEVLFTMGIIGLGLLLFALLIGNIQNFLQSLGRRQSEMFLRRRDVEQWMRHRRLPLELRRKVREAERYNWAATRGVNEEVLMEYLPEDLQRDIRRHLFKFVKKVQIFTLMDEPILDAIRERLRQKTYIKGSKILYRGGLIDKMVFLIRGKIENIGEDGIKASLGEGDVIGEELLTWCLEHSSVNKDGKKIRIPGPYAMSNREVRCLTNVEAFVLRSTDLQEVTNLFARFLRNPRVQGALKYQSPYWRTHAARVIQVAWRYWKKRLNRGESSSPQHELAY